MKMKPADQVGFSSNSLLAPAQQPGARRSEAENRGCRAHRVLSDVDASVAHAPTFGEMGPLPTARSAPSATMSYAALAAHRQAELIVTEETPNFSACSTRSSRDVSLGATCGHVHAGAKRARTLALSGDGTSTRTEPSQPSQLRKLSLLREQIGQDNEHGRSYQASSAAHGAEKRGPQAPALPNAEERTPELQPHLEAVAQLLDAAAAATTMRGCESNGGCRPKATLTAAFSAPCSTSQAMDGMTTGGGHLMAVMSASMPAVLEQLVAATRLPPALPQATQCAAAGGSHNHSNTRRATMIEGGSFAATADRSGADSGPGDEAVRIGRSGAGWGAGSGKSSALAGTGPSGSVPRTFCGAGTRKGGESGAEIVMRDTAGPVGPAVHALERKYMPGTGTASTEVKAENAYVADSDAPAVGPVTSAPPPYQPLSQQPAEPVSSQVGAALPPEVAARLKKPIRIIQPISKAWVKEILQSASGGLAAAAAANVNPGGGSHAVATSAHTSPVPSASGVPGSCFPGSGVGTGAAAAAAAAAALPLSSGTAAAAAGARVAQAWPAGGGSPAARSAAAAAPAAELLPVEISLRDLPARMAEVAPVGAATPAASLAPMQPATASRSTSLMQPRPLAGPSAGDVSPLAARAPARAVLADAVSPFTMGSLGALVGPQWTVAGPSRSGATVMMMPPRRSFESNTTTLSVTPTAAAPPRFSSGFPLPGSGSRTARPGSSSDTAGATATATAAEPAAAGSGGGGAMITTAAAPAPSGLGALAAASPALAALLAGSAVAAPYNTAAAAGAHSSHSPMNGFPARTCVPVGLPLPPQPRPLLQPAASTAASTSASCLGKVQCELTVLYQWYAANRAMYLDQAQRQLQRIEALAAAEDGGGGAADAAAATCTKIESVEAARAFETALNIMSVCGRVEQQWLAGPPAPASGGGGGAAGPLAAAPPAPLRASAAVVDVGRALEPEPLAQLPGTAGVQLPANVVPAPADGWAHGASAALAVAAALVGSVRR